MIDKEACEERERLELSKTKYGKYIVTQPKPMITPTEWSHKRKGGDRSAHVAYLDDEVLKGAFYVEANWL